MTKRGTRDSISAFIGCVGSLAMLAGLLPGLLTSILGLVLIGGAIVTGAVIVLTDLMAGRNALKSLIGIVMIGVLTFVLIYAPLWYLSSLAASGDLLRFNFSGAIP
ncbi:MAG: hypothetical protein NZ699_19165 [Roseiflexus sp.]|nr:hypothetical protein [Roseiflexus sp.]MCS7291244.1 hypothetical protein [Roseiflexus sp.]MDW8145573.1 hypothetical protein [Roseiflexaceae bacterium]MDW8232021.1 hypothetical protein [Roseiflexaceae bacterium]